MGKRILVTGGAGFLGSNLCKRLVDEGNEVTALDNMFTGRVENIKPLLKQKNFHFIMHDITKPIDLEADEIYNAACPASPPYYQLSPTFITRTCISGIIHMLELARKYHAKLLHFSTSEVYGAPLEHPQKENYWGHVNPNGIRSCYDEGKRCAESLCLDYYREYGTAVKIIRIFNTYGINMDPDDGRVVSNFIMQALRGKDITVYGDGSQTRSFCYVDDLIDGIIRMMDTPDDFPGPVNLGNPGEFTVLELANKVLEKTGSSSKLIFLPLPGDDPIQRKPDITLARQKLHWNPSFSLDEGLDRSIKYFSSFV